MKLHKRTAIIDIGSNSARVLIFQRSSKFGFHIISQQKSRVRIGEGAYQKNGELQEVGINRAYLALESFARNIQKYGVDDIYCVATSALRDAPNREQFISWIEKYLDIKIDVIDGKREAFYGSVAVINLLPYSDGITIDIGGGSCDLSLISDSKVVDAISLNLGGVRLKELFFDKNASIDKIERYISKEIDRIPPQFNSNIAIGMGGAIRALSRAIMKNSDYPLKKIHSFSFEIDEYIDYLEDVAYSDISTLANLNIKEDRFDTIRGATLILISIFKRLNTKTLITSGVGVREGVFLSKLLKNSNYIFPKKLNPSIKSMQDRFDKRPQNYKNLIKSALELYSLLSTKLSINNNYSKELISAIKLSNIGKTLTIYDAHEHAFYIASQELNYGYRHQEIMSISMLLFIDGEDIKKDGLYKKYKKLLPKKSEFKLLNFVYATVVELYSNSNNIQLKFKYKKDRLYIKSNLSLYISKSSIYKIKKPKQFDIIIEDNYIIPRI